MTQSEMNSAAISVRAGKLRAVAKVRVSNGGLLAIGGLVSSILISTAGIVWASTSVARSHRVADQLLHRI